MENLCRTCLSQNCEMISIQNVLYLDLQIKEMLSQCSGLETFKLEKCYNEICNTCLNKLINAYEFRKMIRQSYEYFSKQMIAINKPSALSQNDLALSQNDLGIYIKEEIINPELSANENHTITRINKLKTKLPQNERLIDIKVEKVNLELLPEKTKHNASGTKTTVKINQLTKNLTPSEIGADIEEENGDLEFFSQEQITKSSKQRNINHEHDIKTKTNSFTSKYQCYVCSKHLTSSRYLKSHLMKTHQIICQEVVQQTDEDKKCENCNRKLISLKAYEKHMNNCVNVICDTCGLVLKNKANLAVHMQRHTGEKPIKCDECDFRTRHQSSFSAHKRIHRNERRYSCPICQMKFICSSHKTSHMRTHSDEKPFVCFVCQKGFKDSRSYKKHARVHDVSKHLTCSYCAKMFGDSKTYKIHLKQHTGERPHSCEICGKGFIQKRSWRTHMQNHHKIDVYT